MSSEPNTFLTSPLKVVIYRPAFLRKSGEPASTTTWVPLGDIPPYVRTAVFKRTHETLKDWYGPHYKNKLAIDRPTDVVGGGAITGSDDLDDIESMLEEKPAEEHMPHTPTAARQQKPGTEYVTDVFIYPEDRMSELKDKIFLMTGIPAYRQHLFYINTRGLQHLYRIHLDGAYDVDIRELGANTTDRILGIPVDKYLYSAHENIHVEAFDTMTTLDLALDLAHIVYVVDLQWFVAPILSQLQDKIDDKYHTDLFFYGFVFKYWPHFTRDIFVEYITNERDLPARYPDFTKPKSIIASHARIEAGVINDKYRNAVKIQSWAERNIAVSIVQMTAFVPSTKSATINIRNLFDRLRVSAIIPEIQARVALGGSTYILRKRYIRNNSEISFPAIAAMREGVVLAISLRKRDQETFHEKHTHSTIENELSRYLFLAIHPSGKYYIRAIWNEEDNLEFDDVTEVMKTFIDPIIRGINSLGRYVFISGRELPLITRNNLHFDALNACIYWKKTLNEHLFKLLRAQWDPYLSAHIIAPRHVIQLDYYEFLFRKGMYDFDTASIDKMISSTRLSGNNNQYAYMSNSAIKQKWDQNYDGRIVRMSHRTSDIKFEAFNIREGEFEAFYGFIAHYAYNAARLPQIVGQMLSMQAVSGRRLSKLKEQDPELFNLKKHGVNYQYSVKCQKPRQPVIYNDAELKSLPQHEVRRLVKYWNFTTGKPAWYGCPSRAFPHLSFMTGIHPKHYCLPCCNKKELIDVSRRNAMYDKCLAEHMFIPEKYTTFAPHVMVYGKHLEPGRISRMPAGGIKKIFVPVTTPGEFHLYGVQQHVSGVQRCGVVFAMAAILDMPTSRMIAQIVEFFKRDPMVALTFLGGKLIEHFGTVEDIIAAFENLFVRDGLPTKEERVFGQWSELFIEIFLRVFSIQMITFIDSEGDGSAINMFVSPDQVDAIGAAIPYAIVLRRVNEYFPIFFIAAQEYFRTGNIIARVYSGEQQVIKNIRSMVKYASGKGAVVALGRTIDLTFMRAATNVTRLYINRQNYCYAVIADGAYIPIDYSSYLPTDPAVFTVLAESDLPSGVLRGVIEKINAAIEAKYAVGGTYSYRKITPTHRVISGGKVIGVMGDHGDIYRTSDVTAFADLPEKTLGWDVDHLNSLIVSKAPPIIDKTTTKLGEAMWSNYAYYLFITEFIGYIETERNSVVRGKLKELIGTANLTHNMAGFKASVAEIVGDTTDIATINTQILTVFYANYDKKEFLSAIENTVYEFDRMTMARLLAMSRGDRVAELVKISDGFTVENPSFDPTGTGFPNIYLPCSDLSQGKSAADYTFCVGTRLVVRSRREYAEFLADDLADPLRYKYLIGATWADTVVDPLKFTSVPTEIITIYRIM